MSNVKIREWKKYKENETVDFASGNLIEKTKYDKEEEIDGFFVNKKKIKVSIFNFDKIDWLRVDSQLIKFTDKSLNIVCTSKWPFLNTEIIYDDETLLSFKDFAPIRLFNSRIDFTYDSFDFSTDYFGGKLRECFLFNQNKNPEPLS